MNDQPEFVPDEGDDPLLEDLISQLRHLDPPLETRVANRIAIAAELSRLLDAKRTQQLTWWRRSISIPVPLATSLLVLTIIVLLAFYPRWRERRPAPIATPDQMAKSNTNTHDVQRAVAQPKANAREVFKYYETETYLCGIGRVNSASHFFIKEQPHD